MRLSPTGVLPPRPPEARSSHPSSSTAANGEGRSHPPPTERFARRLPPRRIPTRSQEPLLLFSTSRKCSARSGMEGIRFRAQVQYPSPLSQCVRISSKGGFRVARQCSRNRCLARWIVPILKGAFSAIKGMTSQFLQSLFGLARRENEPGRSPDARRLAARPSTWSTMRIALRADPHDSAAMHSPAAIRR
jgi:hypothetical protein